MSLSSPFGEKYQVVNVGRTKDGKYWRVKVGIRKRWPLHFWDWKGSFRHVRTFVGKSFDWHEIVNRQYYGPREHVKALNAIVSFHATEKVSEVAELEPVPA